MTFKWSGSKHVIFLRGLFFLFSLRLYHKCVVFKIVNVNADVDVNVNFSYCREQVTEDGPDRYTVGNNRFNRVKVSQYLMIHIRMSAVF